MLLQLIFHIYLQYVQIDYSCQFVLQHVCDVNVNMSVSEMNFYQCYDNQSHYRWFIGSIYLTLSTQEWQQADIQHVTGCDISLYGTGAVVEINNCWLQL